MRNVTRSFTSKNSAARDLQDFRVAPNVQFNVQPMHAKPIEVYPAPARAADGNGAVPHTGFNRRQRRRLQLRLPVRLYRGTLGEAVDTTTQDLSSGGFFCLSSVGFLVGEPLICVLKLPANDPSHVDGVLALECMVRVIRVSPTETPGVYGVACQIQEYRFSRSVW